MVVESTENLRIYTSVRYDRRLLESEENSSDELSFDGPSPMYKLIHHRDRLLEAARHFKFDHVVQLLTYGQVLERSCLAAVKKYQNKENASPNKPFKLRVDINRAGDIEVTITPTLEVPLESLFPKSLEPPEHAASVSVKGLKPSPLTGGALTAGPHEGAAPIWAAAVDTERIEPSAFTALKTSRRPMYDAARERSMPRAIGVEKSATEVVLVNTKGEVMEGSVTAPYFFREGRWVTPPVHSKGNIGVGEGSGGQNGVSRRWALEKGLCIEEVVRADSLSVGEGIWLSNGVMGFQFAKIVSLGS